MRSSMILNTKFLENIRIFVDFYMNIPVAAGHETANRLVDTPAVFNGFYVSVDNDFIIPIRFYMHIGTLIEKLSAIAPNPGEKRAKPIPARQRY